jgi:plasmid stabilization system protein ParE
MARTEPRLNVVFAPEALDDLARIWIRNAERYGLEHADEYVGFLKQVIFSLDRSYGAGKAIDSRPDLRYILVRRKPKGHGHLAVYRVSSTAVEVLHVFHTAQDWEPRLPPAEAGDSRE